MSAEQVGKLFPIKLVEYNTQWAEIFEAEKDKIVKTVGGDIYAIHHIGSTAIKGLKAKPTIDILLEIKANVDLEQFKKLLEKIGYDFSPQPTKPPPHMTFYKGYTAQGFAGQVFHLHIRYKGDWDEIIFRDYLRNNEQARQEYADLKIRLQQQYEFNRESYTDAKTDFVKEIVKRGVV